ncbi:7691_t:CDS:2, partial [Dentiscutata heterogama]
RDTVNSTINKTIEVVKGTYDNIVGSIKNTDADQKSEDDSGKVKVDK